MMELIQNLREISYRCETGMPLDQRHLNWLGASLRKFLEHRCVSVDEAFGIKQPRGGVPWWREEQMRVRDEALRQLAGTLAAKRSVTAVAKEISTLTKRYAASTWRFDRDLEEMPAHYVGTTKEFLWTAFKSGAPMPLGERQLRQIIGNEFAKVR